MRLSNKVCLVTGASRGIGRATALALAQEGAAVAAVARTKSDLDELTRTIEGRGGRAKSIVCDVTTSSDVRSCVKQTLDAWGSIDILVNNPEIEGYRAFLDWREADYDLVMA